MVPCESNAEEISFEWLHRRISSTDKHRVTLYRIVDRNFRKPRKELLDSLYRFEKQSFRISS